MKNIVMILMILACLSSGVQAQNSNNLRFFGGSGTVIPINSDYYDNFSADRNLGINLNAGLGYTFSPIITVIVEFDYSRINYDENFYSGSLNQGEVEGFENSNLKNTLGFIGSLRISPFPNRRTAVPYFKVGTGASKLTEVDGTFQIFSGGEQVKTTTTYSSWGPILSAGGGFKFRLSRDLSLVTEIHYVAWFDANGVSPVQFSPLKIGIEF